MGTKISWTDETINPVVGCSKTSAGCQNCYAEKMAQRITTMGTFAADDYRQVVSKDGWLGSSVFRPSELDKPCRWKKPRTIFVSSMGDLFHDSVPFEWVDQVLHTAKYNPAHTFIFLTKRPNRMLEYFTGMSQPGAGTPTARRLLSHPNYSSNWHGLHMVYLKGGALPNLVIGVSVEDQATADERIPVLLQIPAAKRFISLEPMIGPVDLVSSGAFDECHANHGDIGESWLESNIHGVILGGESGHKARPLDPEWVRLVRDQCSAAGVPFMFKQDSSHKNSFTRSVDGYPIVSQDGFPTIDGRTHADLAWGVRKWLLIRPR